MSDNLKEWIKDILIAVGIAFVILFFLMPNVVKENSMENTLHNNDYVFASRQSYKLFGSVQRGDIVVFQSKLPLGSSNQKKLLVKRIIAKGGDTFSIEDGVVYVNGEAIKEDYIKNGYMYGDYEEIVIPEGLCFCMGDNREVSLDSRYSSVGLVPESSIVGKVVFRLFPLSRFGVVK